MCIYFWAFSTIPLIYVLCTVLMSGEKVVPLQDFVKCKEGSPITEP